MANTSWYHKNKHTPEFQAKRKAYMKEYNLRTREHRYEMTKAWREANPNNWKEGYYKSKLEQPEKWLLRIAKTRAKKKGHEFSLVLEDIVIPKKCPIMDVELKYVVGEYSDYSPSIDRIDSSKGYIKENIQIMSSIANRMKWSSTKEQLLQFANGVLKFVK